MVDGGLIETWKTRVKELGQSHKVTIVLKLNSKKDNTIMRERGILLNKKVEMFYDRA